MTDTFEIPLGEDTYTVGEAATQIILRRGPVSFTSGGGAVDSVNGQTGAVTISTSTIGAVPTTRQVNGHALTGNVTVTRADVGLGNVDDTSDADKPISTATQAALDLKAPLASPTLTGVPTAPTAPPGTDSTQIATTAFVLANAPSSSGFSTTFMLMGA